MSKIKMPNGYNVFLDNSVSDYHDRLALVEKHILKYEKINWEEYFNDAWLRETVVAGRSFNQTENILERAATYLLMGKFAESDILTPYKEQKIAQKEIPVSATDSSVSNLLYGTGSEIETESSVAVSPDLRPDEEIDKDVYDMTVEDIERQKHRARKSKKRWKQTKTYKLNRLYSTPEVRTYRIKAVKNELGKINKAFQGKPILEVMYVTIGGHKGILTPTNKFEQVPGHISKWCIVDTDNVFEFNGKRYKIDESVKQYAVDNKAAGLQDYTNEAKMDKVLCILVNDTHYFYDEDINQISDKLIKPL